MFKYDTKSFDPTIAGFEIEIDKFLNKGLKKPSSEYNNEVVGYVYTNRFIVITIKIWEI